jgi:hypothetical protein
MFSSAARTTLTACRGYECQEKDGIFMLAFPDAGGAGAPAGRGAQEGIRRPHRGPWPACQMLAPVRVTRGAPSPPGLRQRRTSSRPSPLPA